MKSIARFAAALLFVGTTLGAAPLANDRYSVEPMPDGSVTLTARDAGTWKFRGDFVVLVANANPAPAMRPGGIPRISYNVLSWVAAAAPGGAALKAARRSAAQAGDGFDDRILEGDTNQRTADVFAAAPLTRVRATAAARAGDAIRFDFSDSPDFTLTATLTVPPGDTEPVLAFTLTPKRAAWFSVGYTGAPAFPTADLAEVWQPFIWQEKRFPDRSYLTPAFECSLPATFVRRGRTTLGVVVDAGEFPFDPLPLLDNSRFGVALRNASGEAQPMVFAPMPGGAGSKRASGQAFTFQLRLFASAGDITAAY